MYGFLLDRSLFYLLDRYRFMVNLFIKLCSITVSPLVLSSDHHQLPSQTNCLPDVLRLVEPQPVPVLTEGGGVEGHLPGQPDLAVALVQVDVRFVQEEGEDAGVKSVSDDHSGAAYHRY